MSDSDGNGYADSEIYYFSTGLVMNFNDTELYIGVNAALQYLQRSGIAQSLRSSLAGVVCTLDSTVEEDEVTSIQLKHLIGPFAVHFTVGCLIIVYSVLKHIGKLCTWGRGSMFVIRLYVFVICMYVLCCCLSVFRVVRVQIQMITCPAVVVLPLGD